MFDVQKLTDFAIEALREFAKSHQNETFYAFAIDDRLLCLNSERACYETWLNYINSSPKRFQDFYNTDEGRRSLRFNTGDWEYQGFAEFSEQSGWDALLYAEHLKANPENQRDTACTQALTVLLQNLEQQNAFNCLKLSDDFVVMIAEHE